MQNITPDRLKTCIVLQPDEYDTLLRELFGNEPKTIDKDDLCEKLANHFSVKRVTDVHVNNELEFHDKPGFSLWICYEE